MLVCVCVGGGGVDEEGAGERGSSAAESHLTVRDTGKLSENN